MKIDKTYMKVHSQRSDGDFLYDTHNTNLRVVWVYIMPQFDIVGCGCLILVDARV